MIQKTLLLLRGGFHKTFAFKTLLRKKCRTILIDRPSCPELLLADASYIIDDLRTPERMFELAKKIHRKNSFQGALTFYDSAVVTLGMLSDYFDFHYFSEPTARIVSDKYKVREYLTAIGANKLKYYSVQNVEDIWKHAPSIGYPFILKPTDRTAGIGVHIVRHPNDVEKAYEFAFHGSIKGRLIMEEIAQGQEYAVEVLILNGRSFILQISEKYATHDQYCIEIWELSPAPLSKYKRGKMEKFIIDMLCGLKIENALFHIELKWDPSDHPHVIEINPRPAGAYLLESIHHLKGVNAYDVFYDLMLHERISKKVLDSLKDGVSNEYTLHYSITTPPRGGKVKKISGIDSISRMIHSPKEHMVLRFDRGARLNEPRTNDDQRGDLYLTGKNPHELLKRAKKIEAALLVEFEAN